MSCWVFSPDWRARTGSRRGRCHAAGERPAGSGLSSTAMPDSAAATSIVRQKNGVLPSSTPTWRGRSGSSWRPAARPALHRRTWASQLTARHRPAVGGHRANRRPGRRRRPTAPPGWTDFGARSTVSGRTEITHRGLAADAASCGRCSGTRRERTGLFGRQEVPVHLVVDVDPDAAVHMHRGAGDAAAGPAAQNAAVVATSTIGGQVLREPPRGLVPAPAQTPDVDVAVGQPLPRRPEATDRPVELLARSGVLWPSFQRALEHAEPEGGEPSVCRVVSQSPAHRSLPMVGSGLDTGEVELPELFVPVVSNGSPIRRVGGRDEEDLCPRIGFGWNQERVGDRSEGTWCAPVSGIPGGGGRLHRALGQLRRRAPPSGSWLAGHRGPPTAQRSRLNGQGPCSEDHRLQR